MPVSVKILSAKAKRIAVEVIPAEWRAFAE
jgi:hypothetical protein